MIGRNGTVREQTDKSALTNRSLITCFESAFSLASFSSSVSISDIRSLNLNVRISSQSNGYLVIHASCWVLDEFIPPQQHHQDHHEVKIDSRAESFTFEAHQVLILCSLPRPRIDRFLLLRPNRVVPPNLHTLLVTFLPLPLPGQETNDG